MLTKLYTRGGNEFLLIFWAWCPNSYGTYTTNLHTRHMYSIILICQHCQNWCDDADITNNILVINFSWQRFNADVVGGGGTLAKTDIWEWERSKERWLASLRSWFSFYFSAKLMLFSCEWWLSPCAQLHMVCSMRIDCFSWTAQRQCASYVWLYGVIIGTGTGTATCSCKCVYSLSLFLQSKNDASINIRPITAFKDFVFQRTLCLDTSERFL